MIRIVCLVLIAVLNMFGSVAYGYTIPTSKNNVYPNDVKIQLISQTNLDLFEIKVSLPFLSDDESFVKGSKYPWLSDVKVYYLGNAPLVYFRDNQGYVGSIAPLNKGKATYITGYRLTLPHDEEKVTLNFEWNIGGKVDKGELVYKIIPTYGK